MSKTVKKNFCRRSHFKHGYGTKQVEDEKLANSKQAKLFPKNFP